MIDIRDINPGEGCIRTRHDFDFGDRSTKAGAYLLLSAMESAGIGDKVDEITEQTAATFINNGTQRIANGAIGHCGRNIGKGACGQWQLDQDLLQIVPKNS